MSCNAYVNSQAAYNPDRALWAAVVLRAIKDLESLEVWAAWKEVKGRNTPPKSGLSKEEIVSAIRFIFRDQSSDLIELVGSSPERVRENLYTKMKGCPLFVRLLKTHAPRWYNRKMGQERLT